MNSKFFAILALLITLVSTTFADESFAKLYPENTALFFEFNNTEPANGEFYKTEFAAMLKEPQVQEFFAHTKRKLTEIFDFTAIMTQGVKIEDLLTAFGNHVALGLYTDNSNANALLIAEFPKNINPLQLLATMNPAGPNATEFDLVEPINQDTFVSLKITGQKLYVSISTDPKYLDGVLTPKSTNLAVSSNYLRASSQIGSNRLITAYMSPAFYDIINTLNTQFELNADLSVIPPEQFSTAAFGVCIEEPAFVQRTYFKAPSDSFPYDIMTSPDMSHLSFIPTDVNSAALVGANLKQAIDFFIDKAVMSSPQALVLPEEQREEMHNNIIEELNIVMAEIKSKYGVNPLEDIIEKIDNQITFCSQNTDRLTGLELFGFGGATIIANVKDKEDLAKSLETAINTIIPKLQDQAASKLEVHTDYGTIKGISLANAFTFCYIFVDNKVIFALNPSAIEYTLNQRNAKQNLLSSPANEKLRALIVKTANKKGLTEEPVKIAFMKVDGISDMLNNTLALGASIGGIAYSTVQSQNLRNTNTTQPQFTPFPDPTTNPSAFLKYLGDAFPIYLLPSKEVINKHVFDIWNTSYITPENEFIDIAYGPFPIDSTLFSKDFGNFVKALRYIAFGAASQVVLDQQF